MQLIVLLALLAYMVLVLTNIASSKCGCSSIIDKTLCQSVSVCSYSNGSCLYQNVTITKNITQDITYGCKALPQDQCVLYPGCAFYNQKCQKFLINPGCSAYVSNCNNINQYCTGAGSGTCQTRQSCSQYGSDFCSLLAPYQGFRGSCYLNNQSQCTQIQCSQISDGNCYLNPKCYKSSRTCYEQLPLCSQFPGNCDNQNGLDGFCSWNSLNTSCQSIYCTTNFTADYTDTYGRLINSSSRCNFRESCSLYTPDPGYTCDNYFDTQGNKCQKSSGSSACESSNSTKNSSSSNQVYQFLQLNSIVSDCSLLKTLEACIKYDACIWYLSQCQNFTKCEDLKFSTHDACQIVSAQCTSNNINCIPIDYCNNYPKYVNDLTGEVYSMTGIDGPCGIAYVQNTLGWKYGAALGDCSQSEGLDHFQCSQLNFNCINNGQTGCISKQNSCSEYSSNSTCYMAATLQQACYYTQGGCRNAVCADKTSADSCWDFQPYIDSPTCFYANFQCQPKLDQCLSYITNSTCIVSNNGPCYWSSIGCVPASRCADITLQNICESQNCQYIAGKCQDFTCADYAKYKNNCVNFTAVNQINYCAKVNDICSASAPSLDGCLSATNGEFNYISEGVCSSCNPQNIEQFGKFMFNSRPLSQKARDVIKQYYDNLQQLDSSNLETFTPFEIILIQRTSGTNLIAQFLISLKSIWIIIS